MSLLLPVVVVLLALLGSVQAEVATVVSSPLSVAAFNVQRFGVTKLGKPEVMDLLTRVSDASCGWVWNHQDEWRLVWVQLLSPG